MSGNRIGGLKTKAKHLAMNPNFYREIGSIGGKARVPKGFALMDKEKVSEAGAKGGSISRRGSRKDVEKGVEKSWYKKLIGVK